MIAAHLRRLDPQQTLFVDEGRPVTAGELAGFIDCADRGRFAGLRVGVRVDRAMTLAHVLGVLDGIAAQVLLIPADLDEGSAGKLLALFQADLLISGGLAQTSPAPAPEMPPAVETQWVIPTSGTTGAPKLVAHSLCSLTRTAKTDCDVGRQFRWGQLYDTARFAGLQVFLNSLLSGATLILTSPGSPLSQRLKLLLDHDCNALSATPTLWRKILMTPGGESLRLRQITLGGEIVDQAILTALRSQFPRARISHIYASTEAGAVFTVGDGLAGFPREYLSNPPAGIELRVDAQGALLVRLDRREQFYIGRGEKLVEADGFIHTGDLVRESGGRVHFLGRANGAINVGGNKVQPEEVEIVLREVPGVLMARVSSRTSPITGSLVAADIQLDPLVTDLKAMKRQIISHCAAHLDGFKVPAVIRFTDHIEAHSTGKLLRS